MRPENQPLIQKSPPPEKFLSDVHYAIPKIHSYLEDGNNALDGGNFMFSPSTNDDRTEEQVSLMLHPTPPASIKVADIHAELYSTLTDKYNTCYRSSNGEMIVKMKSSEHAAKSKGTDIRLEDCHYKLEYTTWHSRVYVCPDVRGYSTTQVLQRIDYYQFAENQPLGFIRQKHSGPVAAIVFEKPLESIYSIQLQTYRGPIKFTRAFSDCEHCGNPKGILFCQGVIEERAVASPCGFRVRVREKVEKIYEELRVYEKHVRRAGEKEKKRAVSGSVADALTTWSSIWDQQQELYQQGRFLRLE